MKDARRPPNEPANLAEWLWYVKRYEGVIFVREFIGGCRESLPLSALSPERWARHVAQWIDEGHPPVRISEESERGS